MRKAVFPLLAVLMTLGSHQAVASNVELLSVSGSWTEVTKDNGQTVQPDRDGSGAELWLRGDEDNIIRWGQPDHRFDDPDTGYSATYSGYYFYGAHGAKPFLTGQDIAIGDFYHLNQPLQEDSTSILSAVLDLVFNFNINGTLFSLTNQYRFSHDETPNEAAICADGGANHVGINDYGCADHVSVTLNTDTAQAVLIDGQQYSFQISGFMRNGALAQDFWTREFHSNKATLVGRLDVMPAPVPLPASGALLFAGIAALSAGRGLRRRKSQEDV